MSAKLFIGSGDCSIKLNLTDPAKTRDRTTNLYRVTNAQGARVGLQFGKGLSTLVPARVISFANRKDPARTDRMVMVNAESNKAVAADLEEITKQVAKTLYEGRTMFWSNKPVAELSWDDFMVGAGRVIKVNNMNGEKQVGIKTRLANKIHPATRFFKLEKNAETGSMAARKVANFEGSGRNYEAILACHLDVYTNYQSNRPSFGIYLTCTDCYLKDPAEGTGAAVTIAEADCVSFDDGIEIEELSEEVVLTATGDEVCGDKRPASAMADGFTPSKRQTR